MGEAGRVEEKLSLSRVEDPAEGVVDERRLGGVEAELGGVCNERSVPGTGGVLEALERDAGGGVSSDRNWPLGDAPEPVASLPLRYPPGVGGSESNAFDRSIDEEDDDDAPFPP